jgi:O-antigen/teichoic acid export membrane protein
MALAGAGRADVAVLGTMGVALLGSQAAANREVGWYTVVIGFNSMMMTVMPVVGWTLMPLLSRAAHRGPDAADAVIRRALEIAVIIGSALSIGAFLSADELITLLYRDEYTPAAAVLKLMAPTYVLTYLNVVCAICLAALGRGWTVTLTSLATLVLTPLLDTMLIGPGIELLGTGGGAMACALAVVTCESLTTCIMLRHLGRRAFDQRLAFVALRTLLAAVCTVGIDWLLRQTGLSPPLRVGVDAVCYVGLALLTRSVRVPEAMAFVRLAREQRRGAAATAARAPA